MRLAAFATFTPEYSFEELCVMLRALGYAGVQPRIVPQAQIPFDPAKPFHPHQNNRCGLPEDQFFANPKAVLRPAVAAGLEVTSVASYVNTADMDRALAMLKACRQAGIRNVRIGALKPPAEGVADMAAFVERSRGTYRELVSEARKLGVRPCLELHGGTPYPSPAALMAFLHGFDPAEVGVLYDPSNMLEEGWQPPKMSMRWLGPFLAEVHVKNCHWVCDGEDTDGCKRWVTRNCHLDEGGVHWPAVLAQLKEAGYSGWLIEEGYVPGCSTHLRLTKAHTALTQWLGAPGIGQPAARGR